MKSIIAMGMLMGLANLAFAGSGRFQTVTDPKFKEPAMRVFVPEGFKIQRADFNWQLVNPVAPVTFGCMLSSPEATIQIVPTAYGAQVRLEEVAGIPYSFSHYFNIPVTRNVPSVAETTRGLLGQFPNAKITASGTPSQNTQITTFETEGKTGVLLVRGEYLPLQAVTLWQTDAAVLVTTKENVDKNLGYFSAVVWNTRPTQKYLAGIVSMQQAAIQMGNDSIRAAAIQSRIIAEAFNQTSQTIMDTWTSTNRTIDASLDRWSDAFRGVEARGLPDGTTVKVPSGGESYWYGSNGVITWGNALYNPNTNQEPGVNYVPIHPVR
jgi:hypothetical protein